MQTPVQLEFESVVVSSEIRAAIDHHVAQLEKRFGRITACRVTLKGASNHHRTGGLKEVHVHLALPEGRAVNVTFTPDEDERRSDLTFAINDAFKRARRQLQDHARRLQGSVKQHGERA